MDLRCRKTNCKYNKGLTCLAQKVNISIKNECKTFCSNGEEEKDFSKQIFSQSPPKVEDYRHLDDVNLVCNAKCLFNRSGHCTANGITVNSTPTPMPKCITFMKP